MTKDEPRLRRAHKPNTSPVPGTDNILLQCQCRNLRLVLPVDEVPGAWLIHVDRVPANLVTPLVWRGISYPVPGRVARRKRRAGPMVRTSTGKSYRGSITGKSPQTRGPLSEKVKEEIQQIRMICGLDDTNVRVGSRRWSGRRRLAMVLSCLLEGTNEVRVAENFVIARGGIRAAREVLPGLLRSPGPEGEFLRRAAAKVARQFGLTLPSDWPPPGPDADE